MKQRTEQLTATEAYMERTEKVAALAAKIAGPDWGIDCRDADWRDAGDVGQALEHLVRAAVALGIVQESEAFANYGVSL